MADHADIRLRDPQKPGGLRGRLFVVQQSGNASAARCRSGTGILLVDETFEGAFPKLAEIKIGLLRSQPIRATSVANAEPIEPPVSHADGRR